MRKTFSLLIICLLASPTTPLTAALRTQDAPPAAQAQASVAALVNQDVLDMLKSGLSADIVIAKITSSNSNFDTSPSALQELKTAGVPESVILAMVKAPPMSKATEAGNNPRATVETKVPDGTAVEIELKQSVSAKSLTEGAIVDFSVLQPVQLGGVTIIEKGAPAKARITKAKKAGYWGRAGKLEWAMQDVLTVDGSHLPLRFTQRTTGDSKGGTVTTGAVVTGLIFPPAALLWGLKKGKDATVPAGQRYNVFVHGDAVVKGIPAPTVSSN